MRPGRNRIRSPFNVERRPAQGRGLRGDCLIARLEREIGIVGRCHDRDVGHCLRPELDDASFELRIDAPEQGADVEIEQRAVRADQELSASRLRRSLRENAGNGIHHYILPSGSSLPHLTIILKERTQGPSIAQNRLKTASLLRSG